MTELSVAPKLLDPFICTRESELEKLASAILNFPNGIHDLGIVIPIHRRIWKGARAMPPNFTFRPPYYKCTTIFFTETLADFLLFYALQHKLPLTLRRVVPTDTLSPPLSVGPRSAHDITSRIADIDVKILTQLLELAS